MPTPWLWSAEIPRFVRVVRKYATAASKSTATTITSTHQASSLTTASAVLHSLDESPDFEIEITEQGWIGEDPEYDLCSHGDIRLVIGGRVIAPGDGEGDYTISTSALALLRTLESDHSPNQPVADRLVLHCGMLLMLSCPSGIDWSVTHLDGRVRLHDVVRVDGFGEARFPDLVVELAEEEYRRRIVAFAGKAKELFDGVEKSIEEDDDDRVLYEQFWNEYDERLGRAVR